MANISLEQRFRGAVRLVTLHLWRVAKSTDIDECLSAARERKMIDEQREAFIRECIAADRLLEEGGEFRLAGKDSGEAEALEAAIKELQLCALALNTADPA